MLIAEKNQILLWHFLGEFVGYKTGHGQTNLDREGRDTFLFEYWVIVCMCRLPLHINKGKRVSMKLREENKRRLQLANGFTRRPFRVL